MADKILNDEELNKKPINSKVDDTDDDGEGGGNGGMVLERTPDYEEDFIDLTRQGGRGR